jgi:hypothetical protein
MGGGRQKVCLRRRGSCDNLSRWIAECGDKVAVGAASKRDRTLLNFLNAGYDTMHLAMGYDGNKIKKVCDAGFEQANNIINRCAMLRPKLVCA